MSEADRDRVRISYRDVAGVCSIRVIPHGDTAVAKRLFQLRADQLCSITIPDDSAGDLNVHIVTWKNAHQHRE